MPTSSCHLFTRSQNVDACPVLFINDWNKESKPINSKGVTDSSPHRSGVSDTFFWPAAALSYLNNRAAPKINPTSDVALWDIARSESAIERIKRYVFFSPFVKVSLRRQASTNCHEKKRAVTMQ